MVLFTHCNNSNTADDSCRLSLESLIDTRYSDSYKTIRKIAQDILGPYYEDLKQFYSEIFLSDGYHFYVFVARRSIGLAELFFIILWHENRDPAFRNQLEQCWANSSTDTAIMSYAEEIAISLKYNYSPRIMIIDDLLVQGNGLNELMSTLEKNVIDKLYSMSEQNNAGRYWQSLVKSMSIRIFAQNSKVSVVKLQYQLQLKALHRMQPKKWHDLSRRISGLMFFVGTANAAFIMGAEPSKNSDLHGMLSTGILLDNSEPIKPVTEKQNTFYERHYFGWSDPRQALPKYYCSLRVIKNQFTNTHLLLPFVFLPQLSDASYQYLKNRIIQKWTSENETCVSFFENGRTSRLEYEAMILHLSESLLMCWSQACGVPLSYSNYIGTKVALNYGINRRTPLMSKDFLTRLSTPSYLFSWNELTELLNTITADAAPLAVRSSPVALSENDICKRIEDNIYLIKIQELTDSYHAHHNLIQRNNDRNYVRKSENWNIYLEEFTANICNSIKGISVDSLFRCLLSFMDQGILTLKTRESNSRYAQVLRMGEQSLFIWPQRYAAYYPMLSYLETRRIRFNTDFKNELRMFLNHQQSQGKLESDTDANALTAELTKYLETLRDSGQEPDEWDIGFEKPLLLDINGINAGAEMRQLYLRERLSYMDATRIRWILFDDCHMFYSH